MELINRIRDTLTRWQAEAGAVATEYIVLLVFIALAIIVGATILGVGINTSLEDACNQIPNAGACTAPAP